MKIQLKLLDDNSLRVHPLFIFFYDAFLFKVFFISVTQYYKMIKTFVSLFLALLCNGSPLRLNVHRRLGFPFRSPPYLPGWTISPSSKVCTVFVTVQMCARGRTLCYQQNMRSCSNNFFFGATSIYAQWEDVRMELAKHGGCTTLLPKFCLWGWMSLHGS